MEIGLKYDLELIEKVSDILATDFWVLNHFSSAMIPKISDPVKFTSNVSVFVRKGECKIDIDLIHYSIKAPCVVNIRKSQILQLQSVSNDFDSSFIVLSKRFCDNLFVLLQNSRLYSIAVRKQTTSLPDELVPLMEGFYSHIEKIFADTSNPDASNAMLFAITSFFYECASKCYFPDSNEILKNNNSRIPERFISLVQKNFRKERFLDFYAEQLGVTSRYLSRAVKSATGNTAVEWIDRYIMLEAKVLLKSTNLTIQQVSDELNFPSQSFFGKYFKKHSGLSPKEFRNS